MGTPHFAVPSLKAILDAGYDIAAVVTAADKPSGRGLKLKPSPVKEYALDAGIPILQPKILKDPSFVENIVSIAPDLIIVVAFRMLPEIIWTAAKYGTINLHASLLPQYRGAAPINWAIINGEKETGLTTFFIDKEIDTGRIIGRQKLMIGSEMNAGDLHDEMMYLGASLLLDTVDQIRSKKAKSVAQDSLEEIVTLSRAPKIHREDCQINWDLPASEIHNFVRGLSPVPGAYTYLQWPEGDVIALKIFSGNIAILEEKAPPGSFKIEGGRLFISCGSGWFEPTKVQLAGKQRMDVRALLNGLNIDSSLRMVSK